jgi:hypothetical protein
MVFMAILSSIDRKAVNEFKNDLLQMLRISYGLDKYYAESNPELDDCLKKFKSLIDKFNRKYKGLKIKVVKKIDSISLQIFLEEKNAKECFANSASKIIGLQSIGYSKFGAVAVSDTEALSQELEKCNNKIYLTYYSPQTGTSNIFLQYDSKEKKVQLIYTSKEIENDPSPEFKLAAYYALNKGYDKKIKVNGEGAALGFSSMLSHVEKMEYSAKFDPPITE